MDDGFTQIEIEEKEGFSKEMTEAQAKQYDGFTHLAFEQRKINQDGSTIVQIKYKREIISLIIDLDGGETATELEDTNDGKKLIKGKFGAEVNIKAPRKQGVYFHTWEPELPTHFPLNVEKVYTAKWSTKAVYRVTIRGDERVKVATPEYIDVPIASNKKIEDIKTEILINVSLEPGWTGKDYYFYDFRIGGEKRPEMLDSTLIKDDIVVYVRTNYKSFSLEGTVLKGYSGEKPRGRIFLPKDITSIGEEAFKDCKELESIDLSPCKRLEEISKSAFYGCLRAVVKLPASITKIGEDAFGHQVYGQKSYYCKKVLVPNEKVKRLVERKFYYGWIEIY